MNLAYSYISKEITRIEGILNKTRNNIYGAESGRFNLVDDYGHINNNTTDLRRYKQQKEAQMSQLKKWKSYVSHYCV